MKKNLHFISLIIILSGVFIIHNLYAEEETPPPKEMGLRVEPGGMLVQYVPIGITYDFKKEVGIPLTIYNRDDRAHTYVLTTNKPSTVAARKWLKGYIEIPNPTWFWFDQNEITVPAQGTAEVNMYLKTPDAEKYYNQHWAISLGVSGKPGSGQLFALAVFPRVEIETLSKDDANENPQGILATMPSTLAFEDVALGTKESRTLRIFNNSDKKNQYKLTPMIFPADPAKRQIFPSPTYSWIPEVKWIKADKKKIRINPREDAEVTISIKIPVDKEHYHRKWEAILFIEPEVGISAFARIQIETKSENENIAKENSD
ncbi:hypothetical protein IID04_06340 [PVC group bacterium]|nr:hypothetical protein [PVC group bacterium]